MTCKVFSREEVAQALAMLEIAKDLGIDPAKITTAQVTEIQAELARQRRPGVIETLFAENPLFKILEGPRSSSVGRDEAPEENSGRSGAGDPDLARGGSS